MVRGEEEQGVIVELALMEGDVEVEMVLETVGEVDCVLQRVTEVLTVKEVDLV